MPWLSFDERDFSGISTCADALLKHGQITGAFLPWHSSQQGFHWIVAELLLRRTTRTAAAKAYNDLVERFPSWSAIDKAPKEEVQARIAWVGLGQQRSLQLKSIARILLQEDIDICNRKALLELPGVGRYIADVIQLHVCGTKAFAADANVQRVIRRCMGRPTPIGTRHSDPYRDRYLEAITNWLVEAYSVEQLRLIHLAVLAVGWNTCRAKPNCERCPLLSACKFAKLTVKGR